MIPPGVLRVLKSKACNSAVKFGDHLENGECEDLISSLQQTKFCFSCAHGRPTMVPLVNTDLLARALQLRNIPQHVPIAQTRALNIDALDEKQEKSKAK